MEAGRQLGFDFYLCTPRSFDKRKLIACDLLVINNFFFFEQAQAHFILDLIYEYEKPFVKYEHDHREIMGDQARPKLARILFGRSFLNVFISPFQEQNHRKHLGDLIDPLFILPPAVDTKLFRPVNGIKRDLKKMVNVTGRLYHSKGFQHMMTFALSKQKEFTFEIYTKNHQEVKRDFSRLKNVKVMPPVENSYLPKVYSSAGYTIHLPHALEACGRTIAEGLLCGCKPITNRNVGIRSFQQFHIGDEEKFNIDKFRSAIEQGVYNFWKAVWVRFHELDTRHWVRAQPKC